LFIPAEMNTSEATHTGASVTIERAQLVKQGDRIIIVADLEGFNGNNMEITLSVLDSNGNDGEDQVIRGR